MPHTLWIFLIVLAALTIIGSPSVDRPRRPTWFDILPYLEQSQKQRTRLQQTKRHGSRRYGS